MPIASASSGMVMPGRCADELAAPARRGCRIPSAGRAGRWRPVRGRRRRVVAGAVVAGLPADAGERVLGGLEAVVLVDERAELLQPGLDLLALLIEEVCHVTDITVTVTQRFLESVPDHSRGGGEKLDPGRLHTRMRCQVVQDHQVAALAARQGGVVARRQLALPPTSIDRRVRSGRWHPVHRGVYALGHPALGPAGRRWAAVLACGDGAALGFASAAAVWEMRAHGGATIHVIVGRGSSGRHAGVTPHRIGPPAPDELTTRDGLPITTVARTILDLAAAGLRARPLELAIDQAYRARRIDFADLHELLARHPGRPGAPLVRAVLASYRPRDTRSRLEELLDALCARHGLPRPQVDTVVAGRVRDFAWPRQRLVVEADSYAWHRSPAVFSDDRERDVELTLAGWHTLRFTWAQVTERPGYVREAIAAALRSS